MKNGKIKIAVIAVVLVMIAAITPAFLVGTLRTGSLTMRVGDNAQIRLTNPIMQMLAKYDVDEGNIIAIAEEGRVEAYGPGETKIRVRVPFRTMVCSVHVLGFTEPETTLIAGQTVDPQIAGASGNEKYHSSDESVVDVVGGRLVARGNGEATLVCIDKGLEVSQNVYVAGIVADRPYLFAGNEMQMHTDERISGKTSGWETDDPKVATIDKKGVLTGVSAGTALVSCRTAEGQRLETTVNIVGMKEPDLFLKAGEVYTSPLTSGEGFDAAGIEWASEDRDIVRVDSSGNMRAVSGGKTTVTCSIDGQEMSGDVRVISLPERAFTAVGLKSRIEVAYADEDADITWKSSDESKVRVKDGVLTGVGRGTAKVTAKTGGKKLTCDVSVVRLSNDSVKMRKKDTQTVKVKGARGEKVEWTSEDESVVKVDDNGEITPVSKGETVVYCSIGDSKMSIPVTIVKPEKKNDKKDDKSEESADKDESKDSNGDPVSAGKDSSKDSDSKNNGNGSKDSDGKNSSAKAAKDADSTKIDKRDAAEKNEASGDKKAAEKAEEKSEDKKAAKKTEEKSEDKKAAEKAEEKSGDKKETVKENEKKKDSKEKSSEEKASGKKDTDVKKPEKTENTGSSLTGPEAMIACGNYYCKVLDKAVAKGEKWVYSNSSKYVAQSGSFETMLEGKIRGGNCAVIANWAFRDMGILSSSQKFYGDSSGKIRNYNSGSTSVKSTLDKYCEVIEGHRKSFGSLVDSGKVKVGDVIIGVGHTFVYRGNGTVFASGHDAKWHKDRSVKTDDPNKAVFESWIIKYKGTYDDRFPVHYIIRIKDSFVPKYYRDEDGNLVKNR